MWSTPQPHPETTPVLGMRKAALLADLGTPRSTTELADRHQL
ncbi:MAG: hypothetical protein ACRDV1_00815 [Actinomycetes bacterium]